MATIFRGMSKDNFLDGLVEKTGLNGHELYDYLVKLTGDKPVIREKEEKREERTSCYKGKYEFSGSRQELIDLLKLHDADCYGIGAASPYGICIYAARVFKVSNLVWHRPIQVKNTDGRISYTVRTEEAFLDFEGNEIFTH